MTDYTRCLFCGAWCDGDVCDIWCEAALTMEDECAYDAAAAWVAVHAPDWRGPTIPKGLSVGRRLRRAIEGDPEAFLEAVRVHQYADAMDRLNIPEEE